MLDEHEYVKVNLTEHLQGALKMPGVEINATTTPENVYFQLTQWFPFHGHRSYVLYVSYFSLQHHLL